MSIIGEEIKNLQLRIVELEKQQQTERETFNKTSMIHNFSIVTNLLDKRKPYIENGIRCSPKISHRDMMNKNELVIQIEAIYNILQILDSRLTNIENANQSLLV